MVEELPLCECGCGKPVAKKGNKFIQYHHLRGMMHSDETKAKIAKSMLNSDAVKVNAKRMRGVPKSPEICAKMSSARFGIKHSPERCIAISKATKGVPKSPTHCAAISKAMKGVSHSLEHIAATKKAQEEAGIYENMRGGNDIIDHHWLYDHADLSKYTMPMTRSEHTKMHNYMRSDGYEVPHINSETDDNGLWGYQ